MYTSFFGLNEKPFSITPDPRYLFMSERHTEALAHLVYGVKESGGFIQLTGEVGTGKTTLVRSLLQQVPENTDVAVILNPQISRNEFLTAICEELGVPLPRSANNIKTLTGALNEYLLENHSKGRRTIVLVDEAQNLRLDVLEQVRLLTNLETTKQKLLQIILIGQPELREILARNDMRQLAQRITGRYHLEPLSREETATYIDHRLKVAGAVGQIFTRQAKQELYRLSQGVPRMINVIADRAMLGAFTQESHEVTPELLRQAATEVFGKDWRRISFGRWLAAGAVAFCAAAVIFALIVFNDRGMTSVTSAPPAPAAATPNLDSPAPEISGMRSSAPLPPPEIDNSAPGSARNLTAKKSAVLGEVLKQPDAATSMDNAFNTLFGLWNLEYARGNSTACQQAMKNGLNCLFQRGSLSQVRNLNRPVILTLRDQDSGQHQVVLSGLNRSTAWINVGDNVFEIDVEQLGDYWFGQYLVLWQPQINDNKQLVPGMRDGDIRWLRSSLAEIQGAPIAPMESDLFDQALENRVREYQRERRLTADGVVGYQTQIAINSELRSFSGPLLSRAD